MEKSLNLQAKEELQQKLNSGDQKSFLREVFCKYGNLSADKNGYRLEIVANDDIVRRANNIISFFLTPFTETVWANNKVLYCTNSESICDFLAYIGANSAVLILQNILAERETNNINNRKNNMYIANAEKSTFASMKHIEMLSKVEKYIGVDNLPEKLKQVAVARLDNPQLSIDELASKLQLSKSGVVHRFEKIKKLVLEYEQK